MQNKGEQIELLRFPHKQIRAEAIRDYMRGRYDKAVCFSCGNAAKALEAAGVETLHIGEHGDLAPRRWFTQAEIHDMFPDYFDATSGHLPMELMRDISRKFAEYLGDLPELVYVPTGSGETLICLKMAYPKHKFVAVYNLDAATEYSDGAPLNELVKAVSEYAVSGNYKGEKHG